MRIAPAGDITVAGGGNPGEAAMCWIQTYTGRKFHPLRPRVAEVDVRDIAHALSLKCRFGGHCRVFYSVAEHSVRVSRVLEAKGRELAVWGLMHDAGEAYLPDVGRPVKSFLRVGEGNDVKTFDAAEEEVLAVVAAALGFCALTMRRCGRRTRFCWRRRRGT